MIPPRKHNYIRQKPENHLEGLYLKMPRQRAWKQFMKITSYPISNLQPSISLVMKLEQVCSIGITGGWVRMIAFFYIWVNIIPTGHLKVRNTFKRGGWVKDWSWPQKTLEPLKGRSEQPAVLFPLGCRVLEIHSNFCRARSPYLPFYKALVSTFVKLGVWLWGFPSCPPSLETPAYAIPRYFH